jgi:hypothetical protein
MDSAIDITDIGLVLRERYCLKNYPDKKSMAFQPDTGSRRY